MSGGYGGYSGYNSNSYSDSKPSNPSYGGYGGGGGMLGARSTGNKAGGEGGFFSPKNNSGSLNGNGDSPSTNRGKKGNQALRRLTIRQLNNLEQAVHDSTFLIDGVEVTQVTLVGRVSTIAYHSTHTQVALDDGTGTINVKRFSDENDTSDEEKSNIAEGSYVRIDGHIRSFANERSIMAFNWRPVTSADEVAYHFLECMYAHLYCVRGGSDENQYDNGQSMQTGNPYNKHMSDAMNQNPGDDDSFGLLQKKIWNIVAQTQSSDGCHISTIMKRLGNVSEDQVRDALNNLSSEGQLFSTIDDEHFRST